MHVYMLYIQTCIMYTHINEMCVHIHIHTYKWNYFFSYMYPTLVICTEYTHLGIIILWNAIQSRVTHVNKPTDGKNPLRQSVCQSINTAAVKLITRGN